MFVQDPEGPFLRSCAFSPLIVCATFLKIVQGVPSVGGDIHPLYPR